MIAYAINVNSLISEYNKKCERVMAFLVVTR
jgi:hypothetical protein